MFSQRWMRTFVVAAFWGGLLVCLGDFAWACPTCKDGLANDPARANLVRGYFWSIVFMMSMPPLIFTGISTYFYYEIRKARAARAAAAHAARKRSEQVAELQPQT